MRPSLPARGMPFFPRLTHRVLHVWYRDYCVWKVFWKASLVGDLGEPILYLFALGLGMGTLVASVEGSSYIAFLAPGIICSSAMYAATFECTFGAFTRMTRQGTYDAILATPLSLDEIVGGEILWGATKSLFSCLAMLAVMLPFGLVGSPWAVLTLPVAFATGLLFASLAMWVSSRAGSYDFFSYYFTLAIAPMFLFSGIFFPLESLPSWARTASWFLPLTHSVSLNRALFTGRFFWEHAGDALWLAVATALAFLLAARSVRRRLIL